MGKTRKAIFEDKYSEHILIEGEVYYSKGGPNYFNGDYDPRGYWFAVRPIRVKDGMRSFIMGSGVKLFLKEAKRFNARELEAILPTAEQLDQLKAKGLQAAEKDRNLLER